MHIKINSKKSKSFKTTKLLLIKDLLTNIFHLFDPREKKEEMVLQDYPACRLELD